MLAIVQCGAVQLAAVMVLPFVPVQSFERHGWTQQPVQFACYKVLWISWFTDPGVPMDAI